MNLPGLLRVALVAEDLPAELFAGQVKDMAVHHIVAVVVPAGAQDAVHLPAEQVLHQKSRDGALAQSPVLRGPACPEPGRAGLGAPDLRQLAVQIQRGVNARPAPVHRRHAGLLPAVKTIRLHGFRLLISLAKASAGCQYNTPGRRRQWPRRAKREEPAACFARRQALPARRERPLPGAPGSVLFDRDPDLAVIVLVLGAFFKPAGVAVQFHVDARRDAVVGVVGQPLGKDLLVQPLQRLGHPPGAGKDRPGVGGDGAGGEPCRDLFGGVVVVGNEIFKLAAAHALVQIDPVHPAHGAAAPCAEMFRPEPGHLHRAFLVLERPGTAQYGERLFLLDPAFHVLTTFQCDFDLQRSKGARRASAFSQCGRCRPVEAGKGFGKAVRRIVAELHGNVDDLPVRHEDFQPGGGKPALANVFAHGHAAQHGKPFLEIKGRQGCLPRDVLYGQFLPEIGLDVLDGPPDALNPIHGLHLPSGSSITQARRLRPIFRALFCPGRGLGGSALDPIGPGTDAPKLIDAGVAQLCQGFGRLFAAAAAAAVNQDRRVLFRDDPGGALLADGAQRQQDRAGDVAAVVFVLFPHVQDQDLLGVHHLLGLFLADLLVGRARRRAAAGGQHQQGGKQQGQNALFHGCSSFAGGQACRGLRRLAPREAGCGPRRRGAFYHPMPLSYHNGLSPATFPAPDRDRLTL